MLGAVLVAQLVAAAVPCARDAVTLPLTWRATSELSAVADGVVRRCAESVASPSSQPLAIAQPAKRAFAPYGSVALVAVGSRPYPICTTAPRAPAASALRNECRMLSSHCGRCGLLSGRPRRLGREFHPVKDAALELSFLPPSRSEAGQTRARTARHRCADLQESRGACAPGGVPRPFGDVHKSQGSRPAGTRAPRSAFSAPSFDTAVLVPRTACSGRTAKEPHRASRCANTATSSSPPPDSTIAPGDTASSSPPASDTSTSPPSSPASSSTISALAPFRPPRPWEITSQLSPSGGFRCDQRGCIAPVFALALRVDILHRPGPRAIGIGGFLSTRTDNFSDISSALGVSVLLPVSPTFPLVLSAGGAGRYDAMGLSGGAVERVEFGPRSYNYQFAYVLSGGIFAEARQWIVGPNSGYDFVFGIDADLELTAIPFIMLYTWIARTDRRH